MGIISVEHSSCLFWLGRYLERTFTMQKATLSVYDKCIDNDVRARRDFLEKLFIEDKWGAEHANDCFQDLLFDIDNPHSVRFSLERAYDNGIVLREEISTEALSQIQLAMDVVDRGARSIHSAAYSLLGLEDRLFAFWGCISDYVYDNEVLNLIRCGKSIERLDMYIRLEYSATDLKREFDRLCEELRNFPQGTPYRYNTKQLSVLVESFDLGLEYTERKEECLVALGKIFEPNG
ncbi:MAG: alpha-E domain-containing protein [Ruminococcus sp.]|nr:alpha-E domain-containing protein [Ruminococcus sp.]